ncbi:hypothetical protein EC968_009138 [Mortierella alpina]|nr:hypothetical protein EC968_009138 [Mortierella alpina]
MHGSILFLTLATVALGAAVRLDSEATIASENRMNPRSLAARNSLVELNLGKANDRKTIEVKLPLGSKPIEGSNKGLGIIDGDAIVLKKRKGSFLGLRRRDDANLVGTAADLTHSGLELGLSLAPELDGTRQEGLPSDRILGLGNQAGDLLDLNLKRRADVGAIAKVDLSGKNPTVEVDLSGILGSNSATPCAEGLAAETVSSDTVLDATADVVQTAVTDAANNNVDASSVAAANVDVNGQPIVASTDNVVPSEVAPEQQPVAAPENNNGATAPPPAATDNTMAPAAEVPASQIPAPENIVDAAVSTTDPLATEPKGSLLDVKVNTDNENLLHAKVNEGKDGSLVNVDVHTDRVSGVDTDTVGLLAEGVNAGRDPVADPSGGSLLDLDLLDKHGHLLDLHTNPNPDHLLSAGVGPTDNDVLTLKKRRLFENALGGKKDSVAALDLKGDSQGVKVLGNGVIDTKASKGSILKRRNRDDDDDDEEDDEDDEDEDEVKGSTVKDNKPKDGKETHPAVDSNNDKKEPPKDEPEKHKNSAVSGSTANKIALLGALVGTVFMLA